MKSNETKKIVLSAMFLAIGQVLPFITGQVPQIGRMLSPMHFPVFLCGFFCGSGYGALIGFVCLLLRSVLFGMPAMFPSAVGMAFELMTYGLVSGILSEKLGKKSYKMIYLALIAAMICGRMVWGIAQIILLGFQGGTFTIEAFMAGALLNAIPGIILQLIIIPVLVKNLDNAY